MAYYKLNQLSVVEEVNPNDLLHVRVEKRANMIGDEDRRISYRDFLSGLKLNRFLQLEGGTMVGPLGILKLTYRGKLILDPTNATEFYIGDTAKTFKIDAKGFDARVADGSRNAKIYHELNKPTPQDIGVRTNEENDQRYPKLANSNTFMLTQTINADGTMLVLKNTKAGSRNYIEARNSANAQLWFLGLAKDGTTDVYVNNTVSGANIVLKDVVEVNKTLKVTGQIQPSEFVNFDARYFTQTAANQRFAKLVGGNNFKGVNTFAGGFNIVGDNSALVLKNASAANGLYLLGQKSDGTNKFYLGTDNSDSVVNLHNYTANTTISLSDVITTTKTVKITGQVQPSDWSNIDSRYVKAGDKGSFANVGGANNFGSAQTINADAAALILKQKGAQTVDLYLQGVDSAGEELFKVGKIGDTVSLLNTATGAQLSATTLFSMNKPLQITGQVQPSDFANFNARYYGKSATDAKYIWSASRGQTKEEEGGVAWNKPSGIYLESGQNGGATRLVLNLFSNVTTSSPTAQLRFHYKNGGMWYRTARDALGFESEWSKVYTEAQKPTPAEIGSYTKQEVDDKIKAVNEATANYQKTYPVGMVVFFNSNVNPNSTFTGTKWAYLTGAAGRTIRIANATGDNVTKTGGSDSVTLTLDHLPQHTHTFSGSTSAFDYGTKGTNAVGDHAHGVNINTNAAGNHQHSFGAGNGTNDRRTPTLVYTSGGNSAPQGTAAGNHTHNVSGNTAWAGGHSHSVGIGAHTHTFSGTTGANGKGKAFNVANPHYFLMAWVRTA